MLKYASSFNSPNLSWTICDLSPHNDQRQLATGQASSNTRDNSRLNFLRSLKNNTLKTQVARISQSIKQKIATTLMTKSFLVLMDKSQDRGWYQMQL